MMKFISVCWLLRALLVTTWIILVTRGAQSKEPLTVLKRKQNNGEVYWKQDQNYWILLQKKKAIDGMSICYTLSKKFVGGIKQYI